MLPRRESRKYAHVSVPDDDFAERSRSIFERLRAAQAEPPETADSAPTDDEASENRTERPAPEDVDAARSDGDDAGITSPPSDEDESEPGLLAQDRPPPDGSELAEESPAFGTYEGQQSTEPAAAPYSPSEPATSVSQGDDRPDSGPPSAVHAAWDVVDASDGQARDESPAVASASEPAPHAEHQPAEEEAAVAEPQVVEAPVVEAPVEAPPQEAPPAPKLGAELDPLRFVRPLPRVMAVANQKGGVGKTTTTVNLGASLAVLGYRVLVIDLDPQGNATTGLGINSRNLDCSIYDVILHDTPLEDCIEPTTLRNLFVAPATIDLAGAEIELVPAFSREQRLRRALADVKDDYEFVLIDCPPSLGLLTVNALSAATEVIVPIQCEYYALEGLGQLLRNVNLVQANLNPTLELSAIVLTMYDARTKLAEQVADEVRQHFGERVCRNVVPRTVRLSEAPSFGQPIIVFDPSSRGALAYRELAREVSGGAPQRTG